MKGYGEGRSFVTTGPMILATVNGKAPGQRVVPSSEQPGVTVEFDAVTSHPKNVLEVIQNGKVVMTVRPVNVSSDAPVQHGLVKFSALFVESGWLAVRCLQTEPDGRVRFAHTAPWWVEIEGKPLRPRREQADWFVQRTEEEIARNTGVLSAEQLAEFHEALAAWKKIQATAQ